MHRRAVLGGLALLLADGWPARPHAESEGADLAALEPVYAITARRQGVSVRVVSTGCTTRADFAFYVDRKDGAPAIAFARKPVDACKPGRLRRHWADLTFTYAELGVVPDEPLRVLNPLVPLP